MGRTGCDLVLRGRLCRSSVVRGRRDRPVAGGRRTARGDRAAAELAGRPARFSQAGQAAAVFRRVGRKHGLDGQPLYGQQAAAQRRRLYARRKGRFPARLCRNGLYPHFKTAFPGYAGRDRRDRGFAAPGRALRLLERLSETFRAGRQRGRSADLRHGRTGGARHRAGDAQRLQPEPAAQIASGGLPGRR